MRLDPSPAAIEGHRLLGCPPASGEDRVFCPLASAAGSARVVSIRRVPYPYPPPPTPIVH